MRDAICLAQGTGGGGGLQRVLQTVYLVYLYMESTLRTLSSFDNFICSYTILAVAALDLSVFRLLDNGFGISSYPEDTFAGLSELTFL